MKKIFVYTVSSALLAGTILSSCSYSGYESYLGTMAGAEIGGIIGESIGWMNTSRHSGPGSAMLGGIIGTVAGAAIGNAIGNEAAESRRAQERERRHNRHDRRNEKSRQNNSSTYDYDDYQTEGGRDYTKSANDNNIVISNIKYEDENGDGLISKYETINVIYEVTNSSSQDIDVRLITGSNSNHNFEYSPESTATIGSGKTIRYKAKVFCKSVPRDSYTDIPVSVVSNKGGTAKDVIRIKNDK